MKEVFLIHFMKLFGHPDKDTIFSLGNLVQSRLSEDEKIWLERDFSLEDIEFALNRSANDKAPGPDGFNMGCLKMLWEQLKHKTFHCFKTFTDELTLTVGFNSSFICLIPKKENPKLITDFRPISLINSSVKLLRKVLSLRLGQVVNKLVDVTQSEFIKGR